MTRHDVRRRLAVLICGALALSALSQNRVVAETPDVDDGYIGPDRPEPGFLGVEFRQQDTDEQTWSWLGSNGNPILGCTEVIGNCQGVLAAGGRLQFTAILPQCQSESQNYCIAELVSINADGSETRGQFDSFFPDRGWNDYTGDESLGLPSGGPASIWKFPGVTHAGGDQFFVRVGVSGEQSGRSFVVKTFQAGISAVSPLAQEYCEEDETGLRIRPKLDGETDEEYEERMDRLEAEAQARGQTSKTTCSPRITYVWEPDDGRQKGRYGIGGGSGTFSSTGSDCVMRGNYQGSGVCMTRRAFSREMRFRLVVRLGQTPKGWLHGRLSDPDITFAELANPLKGVRISVTGTTMSVPVVQAGMQYSALPDPLKRDYSRAVFQDESGREQWTGFRGRGGCCAMGRSRLPGWENDMTKVNYQSFPQAWSAHGIDELAAWLPYVGDKATANLTSWSVRTLSTDEMAGADKCLRDDTKIVGVVTTNATQYSGGPPTFNSKEATLDYRVAAPHYRSGGGKFFGIYHLIMRSDLARCLYGFSKAPLNASVSVVDDEGVTTVGTRNISERDGWIKIAALGFGFSAPVLKVKFAQEPARAASGAKRAKTQAVVCVKGKQQRTVSGAKAVCPKGWKRK